MIAWYWNMPILPGGYYYLVLEVSNPVQIVFLVNVLLPAMNNNLIHNSAHEMLKAYKEYVLMLMY
jgi:hypothetical protein